jgi:phosphate starvation-inducible PhoH-like protein
VILPEAGVSAVFGIADENLRAIEEAFRVRLAARGNEISVVGDGPGEDAARRLITGLSELLDRGYPLKGSDVPTAIRVLQEDPAADLVRFFTETPFGPTMKGVVSARNIKQHLYVQTIEKSDLVLAIGPAGTGKTYLAVAKAIEAMKRGIVRRMVLVRPAVEAGEKLGFLPGDFQAKIDPYLRPMYDALQDLLDARTRTRWLESDVVEVCPLAYMRGRTLNRAFVILDEAQNTTVVQMLMFLTRLGEGSRMVVTGDPSQVDLPGNVTSGLADAWRKLAGVEGIGQVRLDASDVVRHQVVSRIVTAYEGANQQKPRA